MKNNLIKIYILIFIFLSACKVEQQTHQLEPGIYSGNLSHGNFSCGIEIELIKDSVWKAFYSNYEENAVHIPFSDVIVKKDSIQFQLRGDTYTLSFYSVYDENTGLLNGMLTVDSVNVPYKLKKNTGNDINGITKEEVAYSSNGQLIHGTIWKPVASNNKALIILTSSGNWDRSSSRGIAMYFARKGFTTFHYDKRGTGSTTGNWVTAPMEELVNDDIAAINYFTNHTNIPLSNTGITGSSQGATKIPQLLNQIPSLKYAVVVSCPGSSLLESDLNFWKNRNLNNISASNQTTAIDIQKKAFSTYAGEISYTELKTILDKHRGKQWFQFIEYPEEGDGIDTKLLYSPIPYFEKNIHPLLIIQGMEDEIIPEKSFEIIETALKAANNKHYRIIILPATNHSMQYTGESDFPYMKRLNPDYLMSVLDWINKINQ